MSARRRLHRNLERTGPAAIPGVFLAKTPVDPEADRRADDVMDLWDQLRRGVSDGDYLSAEQAEAERAAEKRFYVALAEAISDRCGDWASGRAQLVELGGRDGWLVVLRDRDGRSFDVEVTYDSLAEVAMRQREVTLSGDPRPMADVIARRVQDARRRYFDRTRSPEVGLA